MSGAGLGILILLGLSLLGGAMGAWFFQRMRIPQVVGYIVIGLCLGQSGAGIIGRENIEQLKPLNLFALGVIGFLVGGELQLATFRKYARQFIAILLGEGLAAFVIVGIGSSLLLYHMIGNFTIAAAAGVVFGAIASATDPASTIDVLWEYRARGVLTTSITAIVALDDALAMTLYGLGKGAAELLAGGKADLTKELWNIAVELGGALLVGFIFALALRGLLRWLNKKERILAISVGLILLLIGLSAKAGMDVILASMTLGFTLVNMAPRRSEPIFQIMRGFSPPIYVLFFVLVGARLTISGLPMWLWGIVAVYVIGRTAGKMGGAWLGAKISGSEQVVRRYLGLGIFAQGGVAVGLSIMASQNLSHIKVDGNLSLGDAIIFAVTATTLIVQLSGPPLVKLAINWAGEAGRNITEEDVIAEHKVGDFVDDSVKTVPEGMPLAQLIPLFATSNYSSLPVVNKDNRLLGTVSLTGLQNVLDDHSSWQWLLVSDVSEPPNDFSHPDIALGEALTYMNQVGVDQMPVVERGDGRQVVGILDARRVRKSVQNEIIHKQGNV